MNAIIKRKLYAEKSQKKLNYQFNFLVFFLQISWKMIHFVPWSFFFSTNHWSFFWNLSIVKILNCCFFLSNLDEILNRAYFWAKKQYWSFKIKLILMTLGPCVFWICTIYFITDNACITNLYNSLAAFMTFFDRWEPPFVVRYVCIESCLLINQ